MPEYVDIKCPPENIQLTMLRYALLEIRASEDKSFSKKIADIFHNLPVLLNNGICDKSYRQLIQKSHKYKLMNYILKLQTAAEKNVGTR